MPPARYYHHLCMQPSPMVWKHPFKRATSSSGISLENTQESISREKPSLKEDAIQSSTKNKLDGRRIIDLNASDACEGSPPLTPANSAPSQNESRDPSVIGGDESLSRNPTDRDDKQSSARESASEESFLEERSLGTHTTEEGESAQFSHFLLQSSGTETSDKDLSDSEYKRLGLESLETETSSFHTGYSTQTSFESSSLNQLELESYYERNFEKEDYSIADSFSDAGDGIRDSCDVGLLSEGVFLMTSDQIKQELLAILLHDLAQLPETPQLSIGERNEIIETSFPMRRAASDAKILKAATKEKVPIARFPSQQPLPQGNEDTVGEITKEEPVPASPEAGYELHVVTDSEGEKFTQIIDKTLRKEISTGKASEASIEQTSIPVLRSQTLSSMNATVKEQQSTFSEPGYELCVLVDPVGKKFTRVLAKSKAAISGSPQLSGDTDTVEVSRIPVFRTQSLQSVDMQYPENKISQTHERPPTPPEPSYELCALVDTNGKMFTRVLAKKSGKDIETDQSLGDANTTVELARIPLHRNPSEKAPIRQTMEVSKPQEPAPSNPGYELGILVDSKGKKFTRIMVKTGHHETDASKQEGGPPDSIELAKIPIVRNPSLQSKKKPTNLVEQDNPTRLEQPHTSLEPGYELSASADSTGKLFTRVLAKSERKAGGFETVELGRIPSLRNKPRSLTTKPASSDQSNTDESVQPPTPVEPGYELCMLVDSKGKTFTQVLIKKEATGTGSAGHTDCGLVGKTRWFPFLRNKLVQSAKLQAANKQAEKATLVQEPLVETARVPLLWSKSIQSMKVPKEEEKETLVQDPTSLEPSYEMCVLKDWRGKKFTRILAKADERTNGSAKSSHDYSIEKRWNIFRSWKERRNEQNTDAKRTDLQTIPEASEANVPPDNETRPARESALANEKETHNDSKNDPEKNPLASSETAIATLDVSPQGASSIGPSGNLFTLFMEAIDKGVAALIAPGLYQCVLNDSSLYKETTFSTPSVNLLSDMMDTCFANVEQMRDALSVLANDKSGHSSAEIPAIVLEEELRKLEGANADLMDTCFSKVEHLQDILNALLLKNVDDISSAVRSVAMDANEKKVKALECNQDPQASEQALPAPTELSTPTSQWSNWLNDSLFQQYSERQRAIPSHQGPGILENAMILHPQSQSSCNMFTEVIDTEFSSKEEGWNSWIPFSTTGVKLISTEKKEMMSRKTQDATSPCNSNATGRDCSGNTRKANAYKTERTEVIRVRRARSDWSASKESMTPMRDEAAEASIDSSSTIDSNESFGSTID
eukprot:Nitzschia sp. Nitz4//scaffold257_size48314//33758//38111//NITZ4_007094-RA/size48314-processed-gene-0.8-mRNA-1//1//CDS//3329544463//7266//frame0